MNNPSRNASDPILNAEIWSEHRTAVPRLLSVLTHAGLVTALLMPWSASVKRPDLAVTNVVLLNPADALILNSPTPPKAQGGGGGGRHELTPPSLGKLPRAADRQFVPPDPEPPKNSDPALIMESTIVAPQLTTAPQLSLLNIGDPNGVAGPPSSGPGFGGGIGDGGGHGVGDGNGPGAGSGSGGGTGGKSFAVGGGITMPVCIVQIMPDYSDEARKARFQGSVLIDAVVQKDGSVQVIRITKGVGFGLDEKAVAAVLKWKFRPATQGGRPVPAHMNIVVEFHLL